MSVKQILNALDLLEYFAHTGKPASLKEIEQNFSWPRSSTYNILSTLVERGYMYEPARRGGYYPTPRWQRIADTIVAADGLSTQLSGLLTQLSEDTSETVAVAAASATYSLYLDVVESRSAIRYTGHPGARIPIHASASGRALLSQYTEAERQSTYSRLRFVRYGSNALMSAGEVEAEIQASIKRGWFQSLKEYDADLASIALPVTIDERRLAIMVAGPAHRLSPRCAEVAKLMRRCIKARLGITVT
jgi:IclR family transcriptional regulator, acetate operon repressor